MSISISSTVASILASSSTLTPKAPAPAPTPPPALLKIATTLPAAVTKTIITSTIDVLPATTESGNSGSLLREGAGVALNAVYVAMLVLLGLCILFCIVSSACWCFMKHRQDNKFNNFTSEPSTQHGRQDGEQEP
ncbi:hypothetical protein GCK72_016852 [Caenorhabditis remanei]|uniref:Uncharacterized protein n=1 Tax=Caenorhabditis remanei TaxID=31234 RepID=A0A6A5G6V7_CAERE|nr:hypothetical protein GCK72_016852 [Caenorhabditis remanei]KAF1750304.1 hypothetical protein GCK72_016852 [Caenorhabditis remanei]